MMFKTERQVDTNKHAIQNKKPLLGVADLLSYLVLVNDNTILHKDGALSAHYRYCAPDLESCTAAELDAYAATWRHALSFLEDGWMIETNVVSTPFEASNHCSVYPEKVSQLIFSERQQQFDSKHYFTTQYFLSVTWKPEQLLPRHLRRFAMDDDEIPDALENTIARFNKQAEELIEYLRISNSITPLSSNELLSFLHHAISGETQGLIAPNTGCLLNQTLATNDFQSGFAPKMGDKFIKILALDALPSVSYPAILSMLNDFPIAYRWSSRFIALSNVTSLNYLKRYERGWSSKAIGALGVVRQSLGLPTRLDEAAQANADELRQAQTDNQSNLKRFGFYNAVVVLMHEDRAHLQQQTELIKKSIQKLQFSVRDESLNAAEAFLGSIPCHGDYNLRKLLVDTDYVSHALPIGSLYQGDVHSPNPFLEKNSPALLLTATTGSRLFHLNLHVNDVGHTAILGPTGSGKSTLIATLICAHRQYKHSRVVVLDKDFSNRLIIKALQGDYLDLTQGTHTLSPLVRAKLSATDFGIAQEWLHDIALQQGVAMTPEKKQLLFDALTRLTQQPTHYQNLRHLLIQDSELRLLFDTLNKGAYGDLLNGTHLSFHAQTIVGIDLSNLMSAHSLSTNQLPVIQALMNELDALFRDRRPTLLILEEAWLYLRHPLFLSKLTDWFKTLRKFNVAVVFVSQDIADIVQSDAASVIGHSCMTRIFLPNPFAQESHLRCAYEAFGLNDAQIDIVASAIPKRDYYYSSPLGRRLFRLDLSPLAKAFLCVSKQSELTRFDEIFKRDSDAWIATWLREKSVEMGDFTSKTIRDCLAEVKN